MANGWKIAMSAGELSGDEHAAQMVTSLLAREPECTFRGMGGQHLRAVGVDTIVDSETSASVMGFGEVLGSASKILRALSDMKTLLATWKPNLLILIDYQDFNFRLAKYAHSLGIPVLFYVSPSVWAWRPGRIKNVKRYVNCLACIFPFEPQYYSERGYGHAHYVGHPFVAEFETRRLSQERKDQLRNELEIPLNAPLLALLPGSRKKEIRAHLDPMLDGFSLLQQKHPETHAILPLVSHIDTPELRQKVSPLSQLHIVSEKSIEAMQLADAGILKSGTSNLQAAFCDLPFTMIYKAPLLSEVIVRSFVSLKQYSLVNVIHENTVKELIQRSVTKKVIAQEAEKLLFDSAYSSSRKEALRNIVSLFTERDSLGELAQYKSAGERVAHLAYSLLQGKA